MKQLEKFLCVIHFKFSPEVIYLHFKIVTFFRPGVNNKNEKQRVVPFVDQKISIISVVVHQQCVMEICQKSKFLNKNFDKC